jgi:hypothetical protein
MNSQYSSRLVVCLALLTLTACGGGGGGGSAGPSAGGSGNPITYTVTATIDGLSGSGLVLDLNAGNDTSVTANGVVSFGTHLAGNTAYSVTVKIQPTNPVQACVVQNATGTVGTSNVSNIAVSCSTTQYTIGGSISGLVAAGLKLANGADSVSPIAGATSFTFPTDVTSGVAYAVSVATQPTGQTCGVTSGSGAVSSSNVTDVAVACVTNAPMTYSVGGTITGLTGGGLLLANGSDLVSPAPGAASFVFPIALVSGAPYTIGIKTQPTGQTCTVTNASGTVGTSNVGNVAITCAVNTYTVGGSISGLTLAGLVLANGSATFSPAANATSFTFPVGLPTGATYAVVVKTQPAGKVCSVANGAGTIASSNVSNVSVTCTTTYSIGGSVTGLTGSGLVLQNNGAISASVSTNGAFTFSTALATGTAYNVTVLTQPTGQSCTVTNGVGTVASSAVANIAVSCGSSTFTVGGSITDLSGSGLVLQDNGGSDLAVNSGATTFVFVTKLTGGAPYAVTIKTQPTGQLCGITTGSGTVGNANVTSVGVVCGLWAWGSGATTLNATGVYGTQYNAAASNTPGSRRHAMTWSDAAGRLWLFGGGWDDFDPGAVGNDLWTFSPTTGLWAWISGAKTANGHGVYGTQGTAASSNVPGARTESVTWIDAAGNLWLFGGMGFDSQGTQDLLNDLWKYDTNTLQWTWISGYNLVDYIGVYGTLGVPAAANVPPGRNGASSWLDKSGNLWLFGGGSCCVLVGSIYEYYGLNDLWRFNPTSGQWTWMGGSQTPSAAGVYGTQGVAAAGNVPGARTGAQTWTDASGTFWLFGGGETVFSGGSTSGTAYLFNDLWKYDTTTGQWTWVSGSPTPNAAGSWGAQGIANSANIPSARESAVSWSDTGGNLWLFGGLTYDPTTSNNYNNLNDLWKFSPSSNQWTWMGGTNSFTGYGIYGTLGTPLPGNVPGGRYGAAGWTDSSGNFWLFGGLGADALSNGNYTIGCCLNDLWKFHP